jgi:ABC-type uncharacterized transport system substrate-binding protein
VILEYLGIADIAAQSIEFRRAAGLGYKILHGMKPADISVEQPIKFDLVINLTTAKALGLPAGSNKYHHRSHLTGKSLV